MKSKNLSNSEIKELNKQLLDLYKFEPFSKKDVVALVEDDELRYLKVNGNVEYFYYEDKLLPTLKLLLKNNLLKKLTVDMGAIKFVTSGADIMKPGVKDIEDNIQKDEFIVIVDVNHKKPLAIGIALFSAEEMRALTSGKCVKNVHYVGDGIWGLV